MFYPLLLTLATHAIDVASHPLFTIVYREPMVPRIESSSLLSSLLCTSLRLGASRASPLLLLMPRRVTLEVTARSGGPVQGPDAGNGT